MGTLRPGPLGRAAPRAGPPEWVSRTLSRGCRRSQPPYLHCATPMQVRVLCSLFGHAPRSAEDLGASTPGFPRAQASLLHNKEKRKLRRAGGAAGRAVWPLLRIRSRRRGELSPRGADPDPNFQGTRCRRARSSPDAPSHAGPGPSGPHGSGANSRRWSPTTPPPEHNAPRRRRSAGPPTPGYAARVRRPKAVRCLAAPTPTRERQDALPGAQSRLRSLHRGPPCRCGKRNARRGALSGILKHGLIRRRGAPNPHPHPLAR